jgi:hypothetical protein
VEKANFEAPETLVGRQEPQLQENP